MHRDNVSDFGVHQGLVKTHIPGLGWGPRTCTSNRLACQAEAVIHEHAE